VAIVITRPGHQKDLRYSTGYYYYYYYYYFVARVKVDIS
jgi:hypothetical protein